MGCVIMEIISTKEFKQIYNDALQENKNTEKALHNVKSQIFKNLLTEIYQNEIWAFKNLEQIICLFKRFLVVSFDKSDRIYKNNIKIMTASVKYRIKLDSYPDETDYDWTENLKKASFCTAMQRYKEYSLLCELLNFERKSITIFFNYSIHSFHTPFIYNDYNKFEKQYKSIMDIGKILLSSIPGFSEVSSFYDFCQCLDSIKESHSNDSLRQNFFESLDNNLIKLETKNELLSLICQQQNQFIENLNKLIESNSKQVVINHDKTINY